MRSSGHTPARTARPALVVLVLLSGPGLVGACGGGEPGGAAAGGDGHTARRLALRERLRDELGERYDEPLPEPTPQALAAAEPVWERACATCHGLNGRGSRRLSKVLPVPPGDLADPERAAFFSPRAKAWIIRNGSEGTPMSEFGFLDEAVVNALVVHMASLVQEDGES